MCGDGLGFSASGVRLSIKRCPNDASDQPPVCGPEFCQTSHGSVSSATFLSLKTYTVTGVPVTLKLHSNSFFSLFLFLLLLNGQ